MRPDFVETTNVKNFHGVIRAMEDRGAVEACIVVVDGKPGLGKTTTMARWVAQTGSVYVRANIGWDYSWFITDLLTELGFQTIPYGKIKRYRLLIETLSDRAQAARAQGKTFTLMRRGTLRGYRAGGLAVGGAAVQPANASTAPGTILFQPRITVEDHTSSGVSMEMQEEPGSGGRAFRMIASDKAGEALAQPGGGARKVLRNQFGVRPQGTLR